MPTQEQINAANVELQIANDNYAALADRYNKYQQLFQVYASSSPEAQERAKDAMGRALEDFYQTQEKMYAAEDRIQQAQNTVNSYNNAIANQPVQQLPTRRTINNLPPEVGPTPVDNSNVIYTYNGPVQQGDYTITGPEGVIVGYTSNGNPIYGPANQQIPNGYTQDEINSYRLIGPETVVTTPPQTVVAPELNKRTPPQAGPGQSGGQRGGRATTGRVINPIASINNAIKTLPNKIQGIGQMVTATPSLLNNVGHSVGAYNQATTWNGLGGLRNNIQGGVDFVKSVPSTLNSIGRFARGVQTYNENI